MILVMKLFVLQLFRGEMTASQRHYIYLGDRGMNLGIRTPKVQLPLRSQDTNLDPNVEKEKFCPEGDGGSRFSLIKSTFLGKGE